MILSICECLHPPPTLEQVRGLRDEKYKIIGDESVGHICLVEDDGTDDMLNYYKKEQVDDIIEYSDSQDDDHYYKEGIEGDKKHYDESNEDGINDHITIESTKIYGDDGWISPDGRYFKCMSGMHRHKAKELIQIMGHPHNKKKFLSEWLMEDYLQETGWMKVVETEFARSQQKLPYRITEKQIDAIHDYILDKEKKIFKYNGIKYGNLKELIDDEDHIQIIDYESNKLF